MKNYKNKLKLFGISLALSGVYIVQTLAGSAGSTEAINSASPDRRNIVGIEISNPTPEQKQALGYSGEGVYVSAVISGHPADVAGMKVGDVITKIGDWAVTDVSSALENMDGLEAGVKSPIEVYRVVDGAPQKITLSILVEKVQERAIAKIS